MGAPVRPQRCTTYAVVAASTTPCLPLAAIVAAMCRDQSSSICVAWQERWLCATLTPRLLRSLWASNGAADVGWLVRVGLNHSAQKLLHATFWNWLMPWVWRPLVWPVCIQQSWFRHFRLGVAMVC